MNTLGEIIAYVLRNRRGYAFKDWCDEAVIDYVTQSYFSCRIIYGSDANGHISGLGIYTVYPAQKIIHVNQFIASSTTDMKSLVRTFFQFFPAKDWQLTAIRRGKMHTITYNTEKLKSKLLNYKRA
jgi:hypothetical protein